jgi:HSP20 family protein
MQEQESDDDRGLVPRIDVTEQDRRFVVEAELPGVKKYGIDITMRHGVLTINAETKDDSGRVEQGRVIRRNDVTDASCAVWPSAVP